MFMGVLIIIVTGNYVVLWYEELYEYPSDTYLFLGIGLILFLIAYFLIQMSTYSESSEDSIIFMPIYLVTSFLFRTSIGCFISLSIPILALLSLILAPFYSWDLFFLLFKIYFAMGVVLYCLYKVVENQDVADPDDEDSKKENKVLKYLDYRRHPFSVSLMVYVLVVITCLLSKEFNIPLELENDSIYAMNLSTIAMFTSAAIFVTTYVYIRNQGAFFGLERLNVSLNSLVFIYFLELVGTGITLFMLLFEVAVAVINYL